MIENYPCDDKNTLTRQEGLRIRECANAINKMIPHRTPRQRRMDNIEIVKVKDKAKYEKNREYILDTHQCECGGKYSIYHKTRHNNSQKHKAYEANNPL